MAYSLIPGRFHPISRACLAFCLVVASMRQSDLSGQSGHWLNRAISGCNKFDAKPIEFESLVAAIRRVVANPK
jgi:hypothetical protein